MLRRGLPPERLGLRLMLLDELPRSRHVRGLVLFAPYDQLIRQDRKVAQKYSAAATSRDNRSEIKRTSEVSPLKCLQSVL